MSDNSSSTIQLPAGLVVNGQVEREFGVKPMTGQARADMLREDVKGDLAKMIDVVLQQCAVSLGEQRFVRPMMRKLLVGDRDHILVQTRLLGGEPKVSGQSDCGRCAKSMDFAFNLNDLDVWRLEAIASDVPLEPGSHDVDDDQRNFIVRGRILADGRMVFDVLDKEHGVEGVFRFPTGADQAAVWPTLRSNPPLGEYMMFAQCCLSWNGETGPFPTSFMTDQTVGVLDIIQAAFEDNMPGPDLSINVTCDVCQKRNRVSLAATDFLFPKERRRGRRGQSE